jgi:chitodextrinase
VPTGLVQTSVQGAAPAFTWTASTDNVGVTGYVVYRDGVQGATTSSPGYLDSAAPYGGTYTYTVAARDAAGNLSAQSAPLSVTYLDPVAPSAPTNLTAVSPTSGAPSLSWTAATDNVGVTAYRVYRNGVLLGASPGTTYTDSTALRPDPTVASDAFTRAANPGWGSAAVGGAWSYNTTNAAGFWANGTTGVAQLTAPGTALQAMLPGASVLNTDEVASFDLSKVPVGDSARVMLVGRSVAGAQYRGVVEVTPAGQMNLSVRRVVAGTTVTLAPPVTSSIRFGANTTYSMRFDLSGQGTTQLRLRLWQSGSAEPSSWGYSASDSTPVLQAAGSTGIRMVAGARQSNTPMTVLLDRFGVANLTPSIAYTYTVQAMDTAGNLSVLSLPTTVIVN